MKLENINYLKIFSNALFVLIIGSCLLILASHFKVINFAQPFIVQSGSMEPSIPTASIAFVAPANDYKIGDVITFKEAGNSKDVVTHRIVTSRIADDGTPIYRTQGDANENPDTLEVLPEYIVGKVRLHIPYIGWVFEWAKQPQGFILLVIIPVTIFIYEEIRSMQKEVKTIIGSKRKIGERRLYPSILKINLLHPTPANSLAFVTNIQRTKIPLAAVVFPIIASALIFIPLSKASYSDIESSTQNLMRAASTWNQPTELVSPQLQVLGENIEENTPESSPSAEPI